MDQPGTTRTDARRNLPVGRVEFIVVLSMVMALGAVGIDMMLPAFDEMRAEFGLGANSNEVARVVTTYFLGMAVAPLLFGAIADRWGRRPTLWLAGIVYVAGAIGAALAPTFGILLFARFIWGFGSAGTRVIAMAVIRDLFEGEAMARTMSFMMGVFILIPILAPTIGAVIIALGPWRLVFWAGGAFAIVVIAWAQRLGETLDPAHVQPLRWSTVTRTAATMARTPSVALAMVGSVGLMAVMSSYLGSSQLIFSDVLGQGDRFPLLFGLVAVVLGLASFINGWLLRTRSIGQVLPAAALWYMLTAGCHVAVALLTDGRPPVWIFLLLVSATLGAQMVLMPNLNTVALAPMANAAGTAAALFASVTTALGSLLGAVIDAQVESTVTPLPIGMFVAGLVLLATTPTIRRRLATA